jgi:hypothetical protein
MPEMPLKRSYLLANCSKIVGFDPKIDWIAYRSDESGTAYGEEPQDLLGHLHLRRDHELSALAGYRGPEESVADM